MDIIQDMQLKVEEETHQYTFICKNSLKKINETFQELKS